MKLSKMPVSLSLSPLFSWLCVHRFVNGHDHNMQHIRPAGQTVDYFVTGAGHLTDPSTEHAVRSRLIAAWAIKRGCLIKCVRNCRAIGAIDIGSLSLHVFWCVSELACVAIQSI